MKVAIISDIHDNLVNLEKCLNWCRANGISRLICCGDITNSETLDFLSKNFLGQIYLVRGNLEIYPVELLRTDKVGFNGVNQKEEIKQYKNINYQGRTGIINIDRKVIGICHEPFLIEEIKKMSECDIIFYGHTHKPWISREDGVKLVNPGTLGAVFQKATFAVWDTEKDEPELKILELL
ncbi:YfcE family phosphodiesterase [Candidatus Falkowbacteria bacterium]|nr:YfcE family phosphodiesterase [Candidatus Falkowbacteria bacterium]